MISDIDKKQMIKYRYLIAALIDESIGYFTPIAALRAIQAHKAKSTFDCEWYCHCTNQFFKNHNKTNVSNKEYEQRLLEVNHDAIKYSFKHRHYRNLKRCLAIVDYNINGTESLLASWFQQFMEVIMNPKECKINNKAKKCSALGTKNHKNCTIKRRNNRHWIKSQTKGENFYV